MKTFNSSEDEVSFELTNSDHEAITDLRKAIGNAIKNGDVDAFAELCTDDVKLLHPNTPLIIGKEAFIEHETKILEMVKVIKLEFSPVEVFGVNNLAYEVGTQELEIEPSDDRFHGKRKYVHVLKKSDNGQWRFAVLMSNNSQ